ncbi:hypothetical protein HZH66_003554 [Vespula vulgaris]|uniref:oleoyl-[acyl-carrier-protein] hydrolase n=1 Tax=Vespula vulgaris TaxID=7454 RepID=A0A834KDD4_VESVU|nr:hypothetical protein HZH66_003554 [Vespula vulgaris]
MGVNRNRCLSNLCQLDETFSWTIPESWSLEDAATVPIDDYHIGNSRDTTFEKMILQQTDGAGVDIVLNSLAEDKLQASLRCLAHRGRFLEIGKFDFAANNEINIRIFMKGISFHGIMLDKIINTNDKVKNEISSIFNILLKENAIKPIIRTVFDKYQVETALRFMAAGKHMGKVLIKIREENEPLNTPILAEPSYTCIPHKSYVVLGGLGGFGLELIDWLVLRNAQNIVITSRNGIKNGYQRMKIKTLESYGVNIKILVGLDAAKRDSCEHILKSAIDYGPVDGIFNLAVSLRDSICINQTPQTFEESFKGKAWATRYLDEMTRKLCPDLRHFVVFSSVSCGRGNAGQTNYGMANSIMERICEKRVEEHLPGLAIQWGAIGDVGLLADMQNADKELTICGTLQQKISSCLEVLSRFLVQEKSVVSSMIVPVKRVRNVANNVVDAVLNIMGINDLKNVRPHTTLAELGMDSMIAVEIKDRLECEFEIYLTTQYIRNLNFAKLVEMNNKSTDNDRRKDNTREEILSSRKMLMQLFGENLSTDVTISLKTNPEDGRKEIFFLPGIEGYESKIKSPATCFQLAANCELKTIPAMANLFLPHILGKLQDRNDFILVGFSFGSLVAIELTRKLEARGFNGQLILIDGAPQHIKTLIQQQLHSSSQEEFESNILLAILNAFIFINSAELKFELRKCSSWNEKVNAFFNILSSEQRELFFKSNQKDIIHSLYVRLQAAVAYNPEPIPYVRAPITLFKPMLASVRNEQYDYGLQNITEAKVDVHVVDGDHITMLEDMKIAMAINDELFDTTKIAVKILSGKGIPYHSRYIATVKVNLLENLKTVIPERKPRSCEWLSTSETSHFVPNSAICIDIALYRQLQELIGQSWQTMGTNISINLCDPKDNLKSILQGLGIQYSIGLQFDLAKLYPSVGYPVSRGTLMISPLVRWEHSYDWYTTHFKMHEKFTAEERMVAISIADEDFQYIKGHVIDGRNLFPATGHLCLVRETFGMMMGELYTEIHCYGKCKIQSNYISPRSGKSRNNCHDSESGKFEVVEEGATIVTDKILLVISKETILSHIIKRNINKEEEELDGKDIYKELNLRGYQYNGLFRSIRSVSVSREKGHIQWKGNWVAFIDNIFQMKIFNLDTRDLFALIGIQKLVKDTNAYQQYLQSVTSTKKCKNSYHQCNVN